MMRPLALALMAVACLAVTSTASMASVLPRDVTLRWSPSDPAPPANSSSHDSSIPAVNATWLLGRHTHLWSSVSYIGQRLQWDQNIWVAGYTPPHYSYQTDFVPLTVGIRFYGAGLDGTPRGPFVEAGPALTMARYQSQDNHRHIAAMGGIQAGFGLRFGSFGPTHGELGVSYYLAEAIGHYSDAKGRVGTAERPDVSIASLYAGIGIGR